MNNIDCKAVYFEHHVNILCCRIILSKCHIILKTAFTIYFVIKKSRVYGDQNIRDEKMIRKDNTTPELSFILFYFILPVSGYNVLRYTVRNPHCSYSFLHKNER